MPKQQRPHPVDPPQHLELGVHRLCPLCKGRGKYKNALCPNCLGARVITKEIHE